MPSEVDPRLVRLLKATLGLADALRDAGVSGDIAVALERDGGLNVLQLVAGSKEPQAEVFSQRNRPISHERNSLSIGGLVFKWPKQGRVELHPVNDNSTAHAARFGFEEETPALR